MKIKELYYNKNLRSFFFQFLFCTILLLSILFLANNVHNNLTSRNIKTGFDFLIMEAGFEIGESLINYSPDDTYLTALGVGLLNTFKIIIIGNILALVVGFVVALCTIFDNILLRFFGRTYIEVIRNIPLLLQLLFWYALFTMHLPTVKNALGFFDHIFISNRGLYISSFDFETFVFLKPVLTGFNFEGGIHFSPELFALMLGLILYTSAFMAEIIRAGVFSVQKGQWEAASSLGLSKLQVFKYIILPQSLKVTIPPLIGQFLNLAKNSSLAVAIGYPDFVSVANTSMNQTGQAIELIFLIMIVYLTISLFISAIMNWYNAHIKKAYQK